MSKSEKYQAQSEEKQEELSARNQELGSFLGDKAYYDGTSYLTEKRLKESQEQEKLAREDFDKNIKNSDGTYGSTEKENITKNQKKEDIERGKNQANNSQSQAEKDSVTNYENAVNKAEQRAQRNQEAKNRQAEHNASSSDWNKKIGKAQTALNAARTAKSVKDGEQSASDAAKDIAKDAAQDYAEKAIKDAIKKKLASSSKAGVPGSAAPAAAGGTTAAVGGTTAAVGGTTAAVGGTTAAVGGTTATAGGTVVAAPVIAIVLAIILLIIIVIILVIAFLSSEKDITTTIGFNYSQCEKIQIVDKNRNPIDKVDLEDYVAGVVGAEADFMEDLVSYEAMAVAARSFVIVETNHCEDPIVSSSDTQNYNASRATDTIKLAVKNTAGQILTEADGTVIRSEYDAFCYTKINGENYELCQPEDSSKERLEIPIDWAEDIATNKVGTSLSYYEKHKHGRGMSQYGLLYLSTKQNWDYQKILHYFYGDDVVISKMVSVTDGLTNSNDDKFIKRILKPKFSSVGAQDNNPYYYTNLNAVYNGGLMGECTWYAYGRINEILNSLNIDYKWTYWDDGGTFCTASDKKHFGYSEDYTKPKPGSIFSTSGSTRAGHVAIIEDVYYDSDGNVTAVDVSEGGMSFGEPSIKSGYSWWDNSDSYRHDFDNRNKNCNTYNGEASSGCINFSKKRSIERMSGVYCYIYLTDYKG